MEKEIKDLLESSLPDLSKKVSDSFGIDAYFELSYDDIIGDISKDSMSQVDSALYKEIYFIVEVDEDRLDELELWLLFTPNNFDESARVRSLEYRLAYLSLDKETGKWKLFPTKS